MYLLVFVALILGSPIAAMFIGRWRYGEDANPATAFRAGLLFSLVFAVITFLCWRNGLFLRGV